MAFFASFLSFLQAENESIKEERKVTTPYKSGIRASDANIFYSARNKTFSLEINGSRYRLTLNQLSDTPDGVGDELSNKIKYWAQ